MPFIRNSPHDPRNINKSGVGEFLYEALDDENKARARSNKNQKKALMQTMQSALIPTHMQFEVMELVGKLQSVGTVVVVELTLADSFFLEGQVQKVHLAQLLQCLAKLLQFSTEISNLTIALQKDYHMLPPNQVAILKQLYENIQDKLQELYTAASVAETRGESPALQNIFKFVANINKLLSDSYAIFFGLYTGSYILQPTQGFIGPKAVSANEEYETPQDFFEGENPNEQRPPEQQPPKGFGPSPPEAFGPPQSPPSSGPSTPGPSPPPSPRNFRINRDVTEEARPYVGPVENIPRYVASSGRSTLQVGPPSEREAQINASEGVEESKEEISVRPTLQRETEELTPLEIKKSQLLDEDEIKAQKLYDAQLKIASKYNLKKINSEIEKTKEKHKEAMGKYFEAHHDNDLAAVRIRALQLDALNAKMKVLNDLKKKYPTVEEGASERFKNVLEKLESTSQEHNPIKYTEHKGKKIVELPLELKKTYKKKISESHEILSPEEYNKNRPPINAIGNELMQKITERAISEAMAESKAEPEPKKKLTAHEILEEQRTHFANEGKQRGRKPDSPVTKERKRIDRDIAAQHEKIRKEEANVSVWGENKKFTNKIVVAERAIRDLMKEKNQLEEGKVKSELKEEVPERKRSALEQEAEEIAEEKRLSGHGRSNYILQSILFKKPTWSEPNAVQWLKTNHYQHEVDEKPDHYRFRQYDPKEAKKQGYTKFRTHKLGNSGIEMILAYKGESGGKISDAELHEYLIGGIKACCNSNVPIAPSSTSISVLDQPISQNPIGPRIIHQDSLDYHRAVKKSKKSAKVHPI